MEKYGTDLSDLPVDRDQEEEIRKLSMEKKASYATPKNKQEAQDLIEKLRD